MSSTDSSSTRAMRSISFHQVAGCGGRHELAGVRDAGNRRELPAERNAEALRLAPTGLEIMVAAREAMRALAHGPGLPRQLRMLGIVVALAQEDEERPCEERAHIVDAAAGAAEAEWKRFVDNGQGIAPRIRRHRTLDAIRPAEGHEAVDDLPAGRVPEEKVALRSRLRAPANVLENPVDHREEPFVARQRS